MRVLGGNDLGEAERAVEIARGGIIGQAERHLIEPPLGPEIQPDVLMPHRPMSTAKAGGIVEREANELARASNRFG